MEKKLHLPEYQEEQHLAVAHALFELQQRWQKQSPTVIIVLVCDCEWGFLIRFSSLVALFSTVFVLFWGKVLLHVTPAGREFTSPLPCLRQGWDERRLLPYHTCSTQGNTLSVTFQFSACQSHTDTLTTSMPFYVKDCYFILMWNCNYFSFYWMLPQKHLWKDIYKLISCDSSSLYSQQSQMPSRKSLEASLSYCCFLGSSYL